MKPQTDDSCWWEYLSPLKLVLLVINAVCFGGCIVLLVLGSASGPLVLLTIGTGLSLFAGITGALIAARKFKKEIEKQNH